MLRALFKLGVKTGGRFRLVRSDLASPYPKRPLPLKKKSIGESFLQWAIIMIVPPKDTVAYVRVGRKLTDFLTSILKAVDRSTAA